MNKSYSSIDFFKFIMAVCVVALHTNLIKGCTNAIIIAIYDSFISLAVPFFFISSGFLLARKLNYPFSDEQSIDYIRLYLSRMIKLYLLWTAIYFPVAVYYFVNEDMGLIKAVLLYIKGFVFVGEQYNSWHLWYLLSTIYALIIIIILLKYIHLKPEKILIMGMIVYIVGIVITYLVDFEGNMHILFLLIKKIVMYSISSGRILSGFMYISVGMVIFRKQVSNVISVSVCLGSFALNVIIENSIVSAILRAICAVGLFMVVRNVNLSISPIYLFMRKVSTVIYFIHMYVWMLYYKLIYGKKSYGWDSFFVTTVVSVVIGSGYVYLKGKVVNKVYLKSKH